MAGTIMPAPWFTGLSDNGDPVIGGKLYTYAAGTSLPLATYADVLLSVPHSNPIILDGGGRCSVYLLPSSYKFVLKDKDDVTIRSQDNIAANASFSVDLDIAGVAGENLFKGAVCYLGVGYGGLPGGLWFLADADLDYASVGADFIAIVQDDVLQNQIGVFRLQGRTTVQGPLRIGATYFVSQTPGGLVEPVPAPPAFERIVGVADSLTTIVTATGFGAGAIISGSVNITDNLTVTGTGFVGEALTVGQHLIFSGPGPHAVKLNTPDGSDNGLLQLTGGGAEHPNNGAIINLYGNEHALAPGSMQIIAGQPNGNISFITQSQLRGIFFAAGGLNIGGSTFNSGLATLMLIAAPGVNVAAGETWTRLRDGSAEWANAGVAATTVHYFINANGQVGSIATTASATAYNTTSDARLKVDLGIPLETRVLPALVVHDFQWKADGTVGRGLFAQEAVETLPGAVTVGCEGPVVDEPWQMDYSKVVPDLIVGWQQHEARIISLLERLEALESRHDGKTP